MTTTTAPRRTAQGGPPLAPVAIVTTALIVASVIVPTILAGGHPYPSPFTDQATILGYFTDHRYLVLLASVLQFGASVPLAIYAAAASVRLNALGVRAPGATIALVGGVLAAVFGALSASFGWALSRPELVGHADLVRLLHDLAFVTGGPGFVVPLGLLLAGIAVPALIVGLLPRWLAWAGLVIAAVAMLSTLVVAFPALAFLLPIARFPGLAFVILAGLLLPRHRANRRGTNVTTAPEES